MRRNRDPCSDRELKKMARIEKVVLWVVLPVYIVGAAIALWYLFVSL